MVAIPGSNQSQVSGRVLLVEDNPDDILITKRAWKKGKIKNPLHVVNNGEEALDFLYKRGTYADAPKISMILLDLKMPRMNGFEVLEHIKKDTDLRKLPVIMLTTSPRAEDVEQAYELGCNSYIVKPVKFESFIEAVVKIEQFWLELAVMPF
jgi:CheY-like chemotaxis protein